MPPRRLRSLPAAAALALAAAGPALATSTAGAPGPLFGLPRADLLFTSAARSGSVRALGGGRALVRLAGVPRRAGYFAERPATLSGHAPLASALAALGYRRWRVNRLPANLSIVLADGTGIPVTARRARVRPRAQGRPAGTRSLDLEVRALGTPLPRGPLGPVRLFIDDTDSPTLTVTVDNEFPQPLRLSSAVFDSGQWISGGVGLGRSIPAGTSADVVVTNDTPWTTVSGELVLTAPTGDSVTASWVWRPGWQPEYEAITGTRVDGIVGSGSITGGDAGDGWSAVLYANHRASCPPVRGCGS